MVQGEQIGGQTFCELGLPVNSLCVDLHPHPLFNSTCPSKGKNLTSPCLGMGWMNLPYPGVLLCEYLFSTYCVAGTAFGTRGLMFNANKYAITNLDKHCEKINTMVEKKDTNRLIEKKN